MLFMQLGVADSDPDQAIDGFRRALAWRPPGGSSSKGSSPVKVIGSSVGRSIKGALGFDETGAPI
jgi:hypothetical protein